MKLLKKKLHRIGEEEGWENLRGPSDRLRESHSLPTAHHWGVFWKPRLVCNSA